MHTRCIRKNKKRERERGGEGRGEEEEGEQQKNREKNRKVNNRQWMHDGILFILYSDPVTLKPASCYSRERQREGVCACVCVYMCEREIVCGSVRA